MDIRTYVHSFRTWAGRLLPALLAAQALTASGPGPFVEKPYLQLGSAAPALDSLSLLWHGPDRDAAWSVQVRGDGRSNWGPPIQPSFARVAVAGVEPHRVYTAVLRPLVPGAVFSYRVNLDGKPVFWGEGRARKGRGYPTRVVVMGDVADGKPASRELAFQVDRQRADLVVMVGDLVYQDGRISEYRRNFFPVLNSDGRAPGLGAPLLRHTLVVGALGNHDVSERGPHHPHAVDPDALAYYLYWDLPLNGPPLKPGGPNTPPLHDGPGWTWQPFLQAAGSRFPTMGTFSFDAGGVHWTVLDSNAYARWDAPELRDWLARDLERAQGAVWRFVVFHHPAFDFAEGDHYVDRWMGRIWPLLEQGRVDLVFTGHVHTYARSRPIRFAPDPASLAALDPVTQQGRLTGRLEWDAQFDGRTRTRARGVIHIITGGGGAHLHLKGKEAQIVPRPCMEKIVSQEHSFSVVDVKGRRLLFRQLGARGEELDRFVLTK